MNHLLKHHTSFKARSNALWITTEVSDLSSTTIDQSPVTIHQGMQFISLNRRRRQIDLIL